MWHCYLLLKTSNVLFQSPSHISNGPSALYQLRFNAQQNPSCHKPLQKLLLLVWCGSSHPLAVEHSPGHTAPSRYAGRFWFSLLDRKHFQLQMLPAEQTGLYVCGLEKRAAIKEPRSVIASPGNIRPNKPCSNPFQCLELPQTLQRGKESAGGVCGWCRALAMPGS